MLEIRAIQGAWPTSLLTGKAGKRRVCPASHETGARSDRGGRSRRRRRLRLETGDEQGAADSGQETSRQPEAGLPVRRAGRNSAHTSCTKSRSCGRRCHRRTRRRRGDARVWRIGGAWPRRRARPASVPAGASVCDVRRLRGVAKSGGGREVAFRPWLARRGRFGRPWPRQLSRRKPRPTRRSSAS